MEIWRRRKTKCGMGDKTEEEVDERGEDREEKGQHKEEDDEDEEHHWEGLWGFRFSPVQTDCCLNHRLWSSFSQTGGGGGEEEEDVLPLLFSLRFSNEKKQTRSQTGSTDVIYIDFKTKCWRVEWCEAVRRWNLKSGEFLMLMRGVKSRLILSQFIRLKLSEMKLIQSVIVCFLVPQENTFMIL